MPKKRVTIYLAINADGELTCSEESADMAAQYLAENGLAGIPWRHVELTAKVALPTVGKVDAFELEEADAE